MHKWSFEPALGYFFEKIGERHETAWLLPLRNKGFFQIPPPPEYDEGKKVTTFPQWSASRYLVQVASLEPRLVMDILLHIPVTENVLVHEDCVEAACQMPAAIARELIPQVSEWMSNSFQRFLPDKVGALIEHLALAGEGDAALALVDAFLAQYPNLHGMPERWTYNETLKNVLPKLFPVLGLRVVAHLCEVLAMDLALSEGNGESRYPFDDLSWHRIEAYGQYGLELAGKSGRLELLASLLRLAAEQTVQHQYAKVHEVVALLEQHHPRDAQRDRSKQAEK